MHKGMKVFIWAVVIFGIGAVIGAAVMGAVNRDREVSDNPYNEGLMWDKSQREARELVIKVAIINVGYSGGKMSVGFRLTGGPVQGLSVVASRPAGELNDVPCSLDEPAPDQYLATCHVGAFGVWDLVMSFEHAGKQARLTQRVYASE